MCGFFASNDPLLNANHLEKLDFRIGFRGPDWRSGLVYHKGWNLYHARLSIIAPDERFAQPYITPSGSVLVFNGEILNFADLAEKYQIPSLGSDTQVLSALLDLPYFDLNELEGFFALAFIDACGRMKYCARDRFGVKPLFFHRRDGYISISSEASALSDIFDLGFSNSALDEYRVFRAPIFVSSYFNEVEAIKPGSCLITGTFFESLDYVTQKYQPIQEILPMLEDAIKQSVESRMISDVPVGLLYSGGIDSNLVDIYTGQSLHRFTGGFDGDYDLDFLSSNLDGRSTALVVTEDNFKARMAAMIKLRKEPLSVPNEVILSFLAEEWAKKGGKVMLSGEAADELFAGYDRVFSMALATDTLTANVFLDAYAYLPVTEIPQSIKEKVQTFFDRLGELSSFEKVRQFFVKYHLPVLFRRLDFALMFAGVEGREPLAAFPIFKLAMKIEPRDLFEQNLGKFPLRSIAARYFGDDFAFTAKSGFPVDIRRIFTGEPAEGRLDNYKVWISQNLGRLS